MEYFVILLFGIVAFIVAYGIHKWLLLARLF